MRLYLDENLSPEVAEIARARCGLDVVCARDFGLVGAADAVLLRRAALEARCLVTRDRNHFLSETRSAPQQQAPHAGVLVVSRSLQNDRFAAIAAALCAYAARHPDGLPAYMVDYLTASS